MNDSISDKEALASLGQKQNLLCDRVTAVARGYQTGLYLSGPGGVGKSFTVLEHLKRLDVPYKLFNSRMTGKGLFLALRNFPECIHLFEDMERLTKDPDAQGVLRSALWSQPGQDRTVTWTTAKNEPQKFDFRGGLILISNRPLSSLPELKAMATRIELHRFDVSEAELRALMRALASRGYSEGGQVLLQPEQCILVTEHLIKECRSAGCPLDLRLQRKAIQSYRQFAADCSITHWEDLVAASVREATCHFRHGQDLDTPEAKKARRRNILREVMAEFDDAKTQALEYAKRTDASRADFFRRKSEVEGGEFDESDAA